MKMQLTALLSTLLGGCTSTVYAPDISLSPREKGNISRAVKLRDPTCKPIIRYVAQCTERYEKLRRGRCFLAFTQGKSPNDMAARFYTVFMDDSGTMLATEKVDGGREHEPEVISIVSGCPR